MAIKLYPLKMLVAALLNSNILKTAIQQLTLYLAFLKVFLS